MPVTRRTFLLFAGIAGFLVASGQWFIDRFRKRAPISPITQSLPTSSPKEEMLQAWVDTLLPGDERSPAASELGVHLDLLAKAKARPKYNDFLDMAVAEFDESARQFGQGAFARLPEDQRIALVRAAEAAPDGSGKRFFFERTRTDAFHSYYAKPETWPSLSFPHPPQPIGFEDHAQPPKSWQNG